MHFDWQTVQPKPQLLRLLHIVQSDNQPINQSTGCYNFGDIIKSSLPADIFSLIGSRKFAHIHSVACNIMSSTAESNHCQQSNSYAEEVRKIQRKSHQSKRDTGNQLSETRKNFFVLNNSKNGLHKGFKVHGNKISEVQKVISLSSTPNPLNINTVTIFNTTKGKPMAK